jgi:hypothetical protein
VCKPGSTPEAINAGDRQHVVSKCKRLEEEKKLPQWTAENIEDHLNGEAEPIKWYEHSEHMSQISLAFPEFVFELSGEGEESGDVWVEWYYGGKVENWSLEVSPPGIDEGFDRLDLL